MSMLTRSYLGRDRNGNRYWLAPNGPYGGYVYYHVASDSRDWLCTRKRIVFLHGLIVVV